MGNFSGIESAGFSEKLPPISAGNYLLEIQVIKVIATRAKGNFVVSEFRVLESSGPEAAPVGSLVSHMIKMSLDSALGNVKQLASGVLAKNPKEVTAENCDRMVSDENPCAGTVVRASAVEIKTKAGTPFTTVRYSAYTNPAAIAAPKTASKSKTA